MRRKALILLFGFAAVAAGAVWLVHWRRPSPEAPSRAEVPAEPAPSTAPRQARLAVLDSSLRAIEDGDRAAPRDRWDPEYVVAKVGRQPADLFAWVQDSTMWIPYRGLLRGPVGVLLDRQGNSLDRALLLASLLEAAGHSVRLAHAELPRERAASLLTDLIDIGSARDAAPTEPGQGTPEFRAIAARYALDGDAIRRTLDVQDQSATRFYLELQDRVSRQSERLLKEVRPPDPRSDWIARLERAVAALQDHWWVQWQDGDRWIDLDPVAAAHDSLATALVPAAETMAPQDVPAGERHLLAVRLVVERWADGALTETRILDHVLQPSELYGRPIVLQSWPGRWPRQIHSDPNSRFGLRGIALEQAEWTVALIVGDKAVAQGVLREDGGIEEPSGGGPFGGLGAGIAGALGSKPGQTGSARRREMTAAWVEYEFRTPGEEARIVRRAVFDLIGPALRSVGAPVQLALDDTKRLTRSLALMIRVEMLPVTCVMADEYVTHLTARAVLENGRLLRSVAAADAAAVPDPDSLLAQAGPVVSTLYSLAAARLAWSPVGDRVYVDRLGLLTQHRHPAAMANGFGVRGAVDVIAGEVGVSLAYQDAFGVRLRQGVLDTNAEALWWQGATVLNAGEASKSAGDWVTLTPARRENLDALRLPADARARIVQDLANGAVVIAPVLPVASGSERFVGWWRVDPSTGVARGIAGNGWGQCQPEYLSLLDAAVLRFGGSALFEFGLCQGLAQGINEIRRHAADLEARGVWFASSLGPSESASAVFRENFKGCLIGAMTAGVLATLPILLKVVQLRKARAIKAFRPPLPRIPPPPRGPPPKYVQDAKWAFDDAERSRHAASEAWSRYAKNPTKHPEVLRELEQAYRASEREAVNAFNKLQAARRQAGRLPPPPDLNREFAGDLIQVGFGGMLR